MKSKRYLYGLMGLLGLLVFSQKRSLFLPSLPLQLILNISSSNRMKCWRNT